MYSDESEPVVIGTVGNEIAAQVIKSHLESEGIPVLLQYESISGIYKISIGILGEVKILVQPKFADEAKRIIGRESGFSPVPKEMDGLGDEGKEVIRRRIVIHKASEFYEPIICDDEANYLRELKYLREALSCPTCKFDNKDASEKGQPWCNAPNPPEIDNKYCYTFEAR